MTSHGEDQRHQKNKRRERLVKKYAAKRAELKAIAARTALTTEDQFAARLKLAEMPRNSAGSPHPNIAVN